MAGINSALETGQAPVRKREKQIKKLKVKIVEEK